MPVPVLEEHPGEAHPVGFMMSADEEGNGDDAVHHAVHHALDEDDGLVEEDREQGSGCDGVSKATSVLGF